MMLLKRACFCLFLALTLVMSGCTTLALQNKTQVQLDEKTRITLPQPSQLGYGLTASQLVEVTWHKEGQVQTDQLPVQLQIDKNELVLAGFSTWGTRLLSLTYRDNQITTEVLASLSSILPKPENVLFNIMLTLWPISAWEAPLNEVKWKLIDVGNQRILMDQTGKTLIKISYQSKQKLQGEIRITNEEQGYSIKIQTLNYQFEGRGMT